MPLDRSLCCCVMMVLAAACGGGQAGGGSVAGRLGQAGVVRWVDRPAPRYTAPTLREKRVVYEVSAPPCRPDQLRATGAVLGAAAGNLVERFMFTNISRSTCLLRGFPTITGVEAGRARRALHPRRSPAGTFFGQLAAADIAPNHHVLLDLATEDVTCNPIHPPVYRRLAFGLPGGGTLSSHARLARFCGGWTMSRFGLPARTTPVPRHPPGSIGTLRVTTAFPQVTHTRPGRTLRFLITLSNPTHTTVRLAPCPSYTEGIYAVGYVHREWHFLNCDTVHAIPPGHRVRYQMRIAITASAPPGAAKFAWQLDTPTQPSAVRVLVIRPAA